jgi:hypothetical protein
MSRLLSSKVASMCGLIGPEHAAKSELSDESVADDKRARLANLE